MLQMIIERGEQRPHKIWQFGRPLGQGNVDRVEQRINTSVLRLHVIEQREIPPPPPTTRPRTRGHKSLSSAV